MLRFFYNDENAIVICCEPTKNIEFPLTYSSDNPANQQHSFLQLRFSTVYSTTADMWAWGSVGFTSQQAILHMQYCIGSQFSSPHCLTVTGSPMSINPRPVDRTWRYCLHLVWLCMDGLQFLNFLESNGRPLPTYPHTYTKMSCNLIIDHISAYPKKSHSITHSMILKQCCTVLPISKFVHLPIWKTKGREK